MTDTSEVVPGKGAIIKAPKITPDRVFGIFMASNYAADKFLDHIKNCEAELDGSLSKIAILYIYRDLFPGLKHPDGLPESIVLEVFCSFMSAQVEESATTKDLEDSLVEVQNRVNEDLAEGDNKIRNMPNIEDYVLKQRYSVKLLTSLLVRKNTGEDDFLKLPFDWKIELILNEINSG